MQRKKRTSTWLNFHLKLMCNMAETTHWCLEIVAYYANKCSFNTQLNDNDARKPMSAGGPDMSKISSLFSGQHTCCACTSTM